MHGLGSDTDNFLRRHAEAVGVDFDTIPSERLPRLLELAETIIDAGRDPDPSDTCKDALMVDLKLHLTALR